MCRQQWRTRRWGVGRLTTFRGKFTQEDFGNASTSGIRMAEVVHIEADTEKHVKVQLLQCTKERKHLTTTTSQLNMNARVCWSNQVLMVGGVRQGIVQLDDSLHRGS